MSTTINNCLAKPPQKIECFIVSIKFESTSLGQHELVSTTNLLHTLTTTMFIIIFILFLLNICQTKHTSRHMDTQTKFIRRHFVFFQKTFHCFKHFLKRRALSLSLLSLAGIHNLGGNVLGPFCSSLLYIIQSLVVLCHHHQKIKKKKKKK